MTVFRYILGWSRGDKFCSWKYASTRRLSSLEKGLFLVNCIFFVIFLDGVLDLVKVAGVVGDSAIGSSFLHVTHVTEGRTGGLSLTWEGSMQLRQEIS